MNEQTEPLPSLRKTNEELILIAGPCSAESERQILTTASQLQEIPINFFRAGLWKPRTRPGFFEGVGDKGLPWLQKVRQEYNLKVMTEVSLPWHVEKTLNADIDALWIGARTVSDPFAVQILADSLRGCNLPLFVKNPISPDTQLWQGAIERFIKAGIPEVYAVFRGFSTFHSSSKAHRNTPYWSIAFELKRSLPEIKLICDPSHISGKRKEIANLCYEAVGMGFQGLMVESHIAPEEAKTDAAQQITPIELKNIVSCLPKYSAALNKDEDELLLLRTMLTEIDETILTVLARRMEVSRNIGKYKVQNKIPILQTEQFNVVLRHCKETANRLGLDPEAVHRIFSVIHELSVSVQKEELPSTFSKNKIFK